MEDIKIVVVSCTQKNKEEFKSTPLGKSLDKQFKLSNVFSQIIFYDNKIGMSKCYNQAVKRISDQLHVLKDDKGQIKKEEVVIVFVHDDVYITDCFLKEKLQKSIKEFDVVGLAGSIDFSLGRGRIGWHVSDPKTWSGSVEHPYKNGVDDSQTYWSYFGPTPRQVAIIDGLFMVVKYTSIEKPGSSLRFDEDFDFHGYDTTFCLTCLQAGLKIGTTNVHASHMSHGEGFNTEHYMEVEKLIRKKYGNNS